TRTATPPASFAGALTQYAADNVFADIARYGLYASEPHPGLGASFATIADRVASARETITREFAHLAAGWFAAPSTIPGAVLVEDVLALLVAPLAAHVPILFIVVDGMSAAVATSLADSIERRGWVTIAAAGAPERLSAVGVLPSVTEVCRTTLLCGA